MVYIPYVLLSGHVYYARHRSRARQWHRQRASIFVRFRAQVSGHRAASGRPIAARAGEYAYRAPIFPCCGATRLGRLLVTHVRPALCHGLPCTARAEHSRPRACLSLTRSSNAAYPRRQTPRWRTGNPPESNAGDTKCPRSAASEHLPQNARAGSIDRETCSCTRHRLRPHHVPPCYPYRLTYDVRRCPQCDPAAALSSPPRPLVSSHRARPETSPIRTPKRTARAREVSARKR
ncbi:hypothetical protein C2E23DRAFT_815722 [Lenzites betulinus]|nr:hypothetical protein C2E23DRAFT_815722 [Lenzites betulinus]